MSVDKAALVNAMANAAAQYTLMAVQRFETEFPEPRTKRDIEVGMSFEAHALRQAADAVDRRAHRMIYPPVQSEK